MKYINIFLLVLLVVACKKPALKDGEFKITGNISGMENGQLYAIINYPNIDTLSVQKGKFTYLGKISGPTRLSVTTSLEGGRNQEASARLYIEPASMKLELVEGKFSKARLTGSKTQDLANELSEEEEVIRNKYKKEYQAFEDVRRRYDEAASAGANEEVLKAIKEEDNDARTALEPSYKELNKNALSFIKSHPDSYVSVERLRFLIGGLSYQEANEYYSALSDNMKQTQIGQDIASELVDIKSGSPGSPATEFTAMDINGNQLSITDFRGKYLLIDFWASWCVPCRKGNPHLLKLYAKYKDQGFEVLGISDDDSNHAAWRKAVEKDGIGVWRHILRGAEFNRETREFNLENDVTVGYGISSLPTKILIDPDGMIIGRYGSGGGNDEDMDNKLESIFNKI